MEITVIPGPVRPIYSPVRLLPVNSTYQWHYSDRPRSLLKELLLSSPKLLVLQCNDSSAWTKLQPRRRDKSKWQVVASWSHLHCLIGTSHHPLPRPFPSAAWLWQYAMPLFSLVVPAWSLRLSVHLLGARCAPGLIFSYAWRITCRLRSWLFR